MPHNKYEMLEVSHRRLSNYSNILKPPIVVPRPRRVIVKPIVIRNNNIISYSLEVSWNKPMREDGTPEDFITSYLVQFSRAGDMYGNQQIIEENSTRLVRYENVGNGEYRARVAAMSVDGKMSIWVESRSPAVFYPVNLSLDLSTPDSFWFDF